MANFKPLNVRKYKKSGREVTADTLYWKRLEVPTLVKEFGAIDYIDFNPIEPHFFAVTCSVRVQIYNPITKLVAKNLSRFQETAYGGTFRKDGRLLVAGDEQGYVKLFDTSSKNMLRLFKGHKAPVHRTHFTPNMLNIVSFSDDKTVRLWDITTEKPLLTYEEHADYIRAGTVNPVSENMVVSGGYDGQIKIYDTRMKELIASVEHECPVESLLFLPTGGIFLSAGGTEMRVWDALSGYRLLTKVSQHHKTITCLRLGSNGRRIFSGGLDRHVKIYDVATYQPVHTLDYPNAVLSLGVAPKDQTVVAGMVDGLISIRNMDTAGGKHEDSNAIKNKHDASQRRLMSIRVDHTISNAPIPNEGRYNVHLRKFEYSKCLDVVLKPFCINKTPEVTVSVMQELIQRKGLHRALAGRSHASLDRIITFIRRYIGEQRFQRRLIDVAMILLDVYEDTLHEFTGEIRKQFLSLAECVEKELQLTYELLELQGALELLIDVTKLASERDELIHFVQDDVSTLKQSNMAKESSILTV